MDNKITFDAKEYVHREVDAISQDKGRILMHKIAVKRCGNYRIVRVKHGKISNDQNIFKKHSNTNFMIKYQQYQE